MKTHLPVFALTAILVLSVSITPALAQMQDPIMVSTDKESYVSGETVIISGEVLIPISGLEGTLVVTAPNGNRVAVDQFGVENRTFTTEVVTGEGLVKPAGTYTVKVTYGPNESTTTFEFGGYIEPVQPRGDNITDDSIMFEGTDEVIGYTITGGRLLSVIPDVEQTTLIINIEATDDGVLTLTIPRVILDAKDMDGNDTDFFVLIDLEEVTFEEEVSEDTRMLTIGFQQGDETIEIIGTHIIPEFGAIAAMILAVAIISVIAISSRSRLSIIPRY